jgi:hypothetical protein
MDWIAGGWLLLAPFVAFGNPIVVSPVSPSSVWNVVFAALMLEAGVVVKLVKPRGLNAFRYFMAFFGMNIAFFGVLFLPLIAAGLPPGWAELPVVVFDAVAIKLLANLKPLQNRNYKGISNWQALLYSALGNGASFLMGWLLGLID